MRRLLGTIVALLTVVLMGGCGLLDSQSAEEQAEGFSYTDEDDKKEFIEGCKETGGSEEMCAEVFGCYETYVPIETFRKFAAKAIEDGAEADMSGIDKKAQACILDAQAADPEAMGGYQDEATRASFVRECAKGAGNIDDADEICQGIYECLEEKVPFKDFFAYSQAELTGQKLDPKIKKRVEDCAIEVAERY